MNLKTFTARTMPQALALVRQQYGSHGVILHTRTYKRGGVLGIGARTVVEVTAAHGRDIGREKRKTARQSPRAQVASALSQTARRPAPALVEAEDPSTAGDLIKRTYAAARAELQREPVEVKVPQAVAPSVVTAAIPDQDLLADEMKSVKQMVAQMVQQQRRQGLAAAPPNLPEPLFDRYLALLEQEVGDELAAEIIREVHATLGDAGLSDNQAIHTAIRQKIAAFLPTDTADDRLVVSEDGRPRTLALIGPTGVGKTTTIAKLAATFKLKERKRVGLITLDTYRIAAVEQLKTYAGIIGVPLQVATSVAELSQALERCKDCDVVLIDTAGRAPRDTSRISELSGFLAAARPHETHLVLSSTCTESVLMETVDRFAKIDYDRIIFTKLDEAVTFGVLLNVSRRVNKRLSYVTTGQEVPHQIEATESSRLAGLLLGEELNK